MNANSNLPPKMQIKCLKYFAHIDDDDEDKGKDLAAIL